MSVKVTFIVPAHNEAPTIARVLRGMQALQLNSQVIVVDDGSSDGTGDIASTFSKVEVIRQQNLGKGAAIRAALPRVEGDIAVIHDADMEYDPSEVPALIDLIARADAQVVYGARTFTPRTRGGRLVPYVLANRLVSRFACILFRTTTIADVHTGQKAFRTEVLRALDLTCDDFAVDSEITCKLWKQKLRIHEVPVSYRRRSVAEGKKLRWRDGVKVVWVLLRIRLAR